MNIGVGYGRNTPMNSDLLSSSFLVTESPRIQANSSADEKGKDTLKGLFSEEEPTSVLAVRVECK